MIDIAELVAENIDIWTCAIQRKSGAGRGGGRRISLYGIERLRALIYDLAATGRLVSGDAVALAKLGGHVELVMGQAPPGNACNTNGDGTVFVKTGEFGSLYPAIREWTTKPLKMAKSGDVLICVVGATIGKLNLAIDCAIGRSVAAIRPKRTLETIYLYYALMPFTLRLRGGARGSAQGVIGKAELNAVSMRIPPVAEQRRIVAKVDELMALCDELEQESAAAMAAHQTLVEVLLSTLVNSADAEDLARQWAQLESHFDTLFTTDGSIDALKQCVLDLAVRGKLVKRETPSPIKWIEAPLEKLIGPMDSGWSPACHEYQSTSDDVWGVLKTTAVQDMRYDAEQNKELPAKFEPRPDAEARVGDILITRAGPTNRVGICCFVASTRPRLMISDKIIRFRPISSVVEGAFLVLALSVGKAAQQIAKAKSGMAASQVNISQSKLKAIIVPVPELAEQRRIVAKVDALMALCDALHARIADAAQTQRHLADAITERAAA